MGVSLRVRGLYVLLSQYFRYAPYVPVIFDTYGIAFISNDKCKDSIVSVSAVDFNNVQKQHLGDMEV